MMSRINDIKTRFYLAYLLVKNTDNVPIRILKCDKCGGIKFKTVETIIDDGNAFQAKYRCLKCGWDILDTQEYM